MTLTMTTDAWSGVHSDDQTLEVSEWAQVRSAIERLDGRTYTLVLLTRCEETSLTVGGGPDRFVVYLTTADERFPTLLDPSKSASETERLVTGGQLGEFPAQTVVGLDAALRAAEVFYELGTQDATQEWNEG